MEFKKISECEMKLTAGLPINRNLANSEEETKEKRRVCAPKYMTSYGKMDMENLLLEEEQGFNRELSSDKNRKITKSGDIILKLCPDYSAVKIDESSEGLVIGSFCVLVENKDFDIDYLLAFFNSDMYRRQVKKTVHGLLATLSAKAIKDVVIPVPSKEIQEQIGKQYIESMKNIELINRISALEAKKNDCIFAELEAEKNA